jgi:hypothetical protein
LFVRGDLFADGIYQFAMSEYVKDKSTPAGWKMVTYPKDKDLATADTSNLTADAMDEGADEGGGDNAEPDNRTE